MKRWHIPTLCLVFLLWVPVLQASAETLIEKTEVSGTEKQHLEEIRQKCGTNPGCYNVEMAPYTAEGEKAFTASVEKIDPAFRKKIFDTFISSTKPGPDGPITINEPPCGEEIDAFVQTQCMIHRLDDLLKDPKLASYSRAELQQARNAAANSRLALKFRSMVMAQCLKSPSSGSCQKNPHFETPPKRAFKFLPEKENPLAKSWDSYLAGKKKAGTGAADEEADNKIFNQCMLGEGKSGANPFEGGLERADACRRVRGTQLESFVTDIEKITASTRVQQYFNLIRLEAVSRLLQAHRDLLGKDIAGTPEGCEAFDSGIQKFKARKPMPQGLIHRVPPEAAQAAAKDAERYLKDIALLKGSKCIVDCNGASCHETPICPDSGGGSGTVTRTNQKYLKETQLRLGNILEKHPYLRAGHDPQVGLEGAFPKVTQIASSKDTAAVKAALAQGEAELSNSLKQSMQAYCQEKTSGKSAGLVSQVWDPASTQALQGPPPPVPVASLLHNEKLVAATLAKFPEYASFQRCALEKVEEDESAKAYAKKLGAGACMIAGLSPAQIVLGPICGLTALAEGVGKWTEEKSKLDFESHCRVAGNQVCTTESELKSYERYRAAVRGLGYAAFGAGWEVTATARAVSSFRALRAAPEEFDALAVELQRIRKIEDAVQREKELVALEAKVMAKHPPQANPQEVIDQVGEWSLDYVNKLRPDEARALIRMSKETGKPLSEIIREFKDTHLRPHPIEIPGEPIEYVNSRRVPAMTSVRTMRIAKSAGLTTTEVRMGAVKGLRDYKVPVRHWSSSNFDNTASFEAEAVFVYEQVKLHSKDPAAVIQDLNEAYGIVAKISKKYPLPEIAQRKIRPDDFVEAVSLAYQKGKPVGATVAEIEKTVQEVGSYRVLLMDEELGFNEALRIHQLAQRTGKPVSEIVSYVKESAKKIKDSDPETWKPVDLAEAHFEAL